MPNLKNNIESISNDTESLVRDHVKLFSLRLTEKLSMFLGVLFSIFIFSILVLILIVFISFVFAGYLNEILNKDYLGFLIVLGIYVACIFFLIRRLLVQGKPLLVNMFVQFVAMALDVDLKQSQNLQGIHIEREIIDIKIESEKDKIKTNFQMLRYLIFDSLFTELVGMFSGKKPSNSGDENSDKQESQKPENE